MLGNVWQSNKLEIINMQRLKQPLEEYDTFCCTRVLRVSVEEGGR